MKPAVIRERRAVTEREREEYDRFGPWTYQVRSAAAMPPRFDAYYEELEGSVLVLKLPRGVERRDANPGDDLYEAILAVGSAGVTFLRLTRGEVLRWDACFAEVAAVRLSQELLSGELRIDLSGGGVISVTFNTVSAEAFDDFALAVRRGRVAAAGAADSRRFSSVELGPEPTDEDMLFANLLRGLRRREARLGLLAYQPSRALASERGGGKRGPLSLAARLLPWRLDGCLLAATPSELVILVRGIVANGARLRALRISSDGPDLELLFEEVPSGALAALPGP